MNAVCFCGKSLATWMIILSMGILAGCSGGSENGGPTAPPQPLAVQYPVDGRIDFAVLPDVQSADVDFYDYSSSGPVVKSTRLQWAMVNDDRYLYMALAWNDDTYNHDFDATAGPVDFDGVTLLFDNDGNGQHEIGEDKRTVIAASVGSQFIDQHVVASGDASDQIGDGQARLTYDSADQLYQAEFLIPLGEDAAGQDGVLNAQTRYSIILWDHIRPSGPSGNIAAPWGGGPDSGSWPRLAYQPAAPHAYPALPAGLTGLIIFTSNHEAANNEIYSFDPATGVVRRITNLPGLYKDNPSLSHDRRRIAFHGAPSATDYAGYEIYTIDIDGTGLTRLTDNTVLDGHPAWSPDDNRIAYASFGSDGRAHIVTMTPAGTDAVDLTPAGKDDNDPDYLPDGRIVFKTDRFSTSPQVHIAVMDADGTNVVQVTAINGTSDHDPLGNDAYVLCERFNKATNYATDPEAGFTPWDIIEAKLDGSQERIVMADGWVNWLPVYSPGGGYILYLKSQPYTSAHLMTLDGVDLGRLIPNITSIRYIDWK
jgi:WD40-like Beta Propeller Repeat